MTDTGPASGVQLIGLEKRFGDVTAVRTLDLDVARGALVVLVGPSGCGKTTVLRMIAGLEEPTAGEIYIDGKSVRDLEPADRDVAMVFQNYALYPHMTVRDNLSFGLRMRSTPRAEVARRLGWAAGVLGLEALLDRLPAQLSGGQKQRVAFGRALVREPRLFLFDEPLSNLDARLRAELREEIAGLHARLDATMIFVTHDQVEAMTLGDRVAVFRDGALQQYAPPQDVYRRPKNLWVARFVGSPVINTVDGAVGVDGGAWFRAPGLALRLDGTAPEGPAVLGIRPEALEIVTSDGGCADFRSAIRRVEPLGNELLVHVDGPGVGGWIARVDPERPVAVGDPVGVRLAAGLAHVFAGPDLPRLAVTCRRDPA